MGIIDVKDLEAISFLFRGPGGRRRAEYMMRMCALDKVNQVYEHSSEYKGADFAARLLDDLGVNYVIGNAERLERLPDGAFITVSNHPYGGLDGIILIDLMAGIRPDYKLMVNRMLSLVEPMKENFISVTPTGKKNNGVTGTSISGIRETMTCFQKGHPVGFFPSGAVSNFSFNDLRVRDRQWQSSIFHLIHSVKVPILPIRFFDKNSPLFYFLGVIHWRIRSFRLPGELFNKRHHVPRIGIGNIISVQEQEQFTDPEALGAFLRKVVYDMPKAASFTPRSLLNYPEKPL